jgi:hypothetical protein
MEHLNLPFSPVGALGFVWGFLGGFMGTVVFRFHFMISKVKYVGAPDR